MKTQTTTLSRTSAILKCCAVALLIASAVSLAGKVSLHEFMLNILSWDSM